jgi:hypothetical protein
VVQVERAVKAGGIRIEAVGVLHGELPRTDQPALRPGLVAELGLELVPALRQVPVGAQLQRQGGEDLLVGHAEGDVGPLAVAQAEHLLAHRVPTARPLPDLGRMHRRQDELLRSDAVHLLADDVDDLGPDPHREREQHVVARHQLADEASPDQQAVAGRLRVGGVFPECRNIGL